MYRRVKRWKVEDRIELDRVVGKGGETESSAW